MMTSALRDHLDVVAATIANLDHALQQLPPAEEFPVQTTADAIFVLSQVREMEPLISKLFKYRANLLRNFNMFSSSICKLPPEALGEIFRYVCHPDSERAMAPTKIGAVCSHWRRVAWSDPRLWTELSVGWKTWESPYGAKLLDLYYENMGGSHYGITLSLPVREDHKGLRGIPFEDVFEQIFVKHPDKLKTLNFQGPMKFWIPHIDHITKCGRGLPNLKSLVINTKSLLYTSEDSCITVFCKAPRLTKVDLTFVRPTLTFPWAQLTELRLHATSSELALNIALQCENLVTLKLEDLSKGLEELSVTLPDGLTVLRNLQTFEYKSSYLSARWEQALVRCLLFTTSLKKLTWLTKGGTKELRRGFLLRLPTSITNLWIDCRAERDGVQDLKEIFARLTSLRNITLYLDDPLDLEVIKLFAITDEYCLLPSLRWIELAMMWYEYDEQQMSDFEDVRKSRSAIRDEKDPFEKFVLRFPNVEGYTLDSWFQ